jgi:PAT family beta-lactamase induction signal transducer AmpG
MLPNLLATRRGRLAAFFALYITEGIPLGFAATAVAFQLRKMGVGPAEIGAFVGSFYLPWAFKWAFGPLVDVFRSQRWGHRRAWIIACQLVMAATLAALVMVDLPGGLGLFTGILLVHNTFAAMQDVAIDALACNSLREDERGLGNGLMFAGAAIGTALGGAGVLKLMPHTGFQPTFFVVAAAILTVTLVIVVPMREPRAPDPPSNGRSGWRRVGHEMRDFSVESFRSFLATRGALAGVGFALLPAGAMALGLSLRSTLSAEFGLSESEAGTLELWSNIISATGMVLGGWLSDRLGRQRTLSAYLALMSLPAAWLGWRLHQLGYIMPQAPGGAGPGALGPLLASALWVASMSYSFFLGLMYGTRSAIMMDVTNPKVAGTQFTAYMAMMNLAIAYSATWQGLSAEALGYPKTLFLDAGVGLLSLLLLPWIRPATGSEAPDAPARRARAVAGVLALACLGWLPFAAWGSHLGRAQSIVALFFTLVFVASAIVLLAAAALWPRGAFSRGAPWVAAALLAIYARRFFDPSLPAQVLTCAAALAGALLLAWLARQPWRELR